MEAEPFRILLVEDNEADIYLMRKALESEGKGRSKRATKNVD